MIDYGLDGKVVVVTGGGSGIGLASAKAFAAEGCKVVVGDLNPPDAETLGGEHPAVTLELDFRDPTAAAKLVAAAVEAHGGVDVLFNNVGIAPFREGFLAVSEEQWAELLSINFMTMARSCKAAIPEMLKRGGGAIVSIASDAGRQPDPFFVDYAVSKSAILSLSKSISMEFGSQGIRSNCVSPGPTVTAAMDKFLDALAVEKGIDRDTAPDFFAKEMRNLPLGRMNDPADVAAVVLFLAGDRARQVTGSEYCVDAGSIVSA